MYTSFACHTYLSCKGLGVPGMWAGSEGCGGLPLL